MNSEMLIFDGGAVKALGEGKVGGYGVFFTNELQPDLDGDFFTKDTDFQLEDRTALPIYFGHGIDPTLKKQKLARASFKMEDQGLWVETQLDLRDRWQKKIHELIAQGKLSFSSGAVSHLVERVKKGAANWIQTWPLSECSFTPAPSAPFGTEVIALKAYDALSLKEVYRRSQLTETQLMREENERIRERVEATLGLREHPEAFARRQIERAGRAEQSRADRETVQLTLSEAKERLAVLDDLKNQFDNLIAEQKRINNILSPKFPPGAMPAWANRHWW